MIKKFIGLTLAGIFFGSGVGLAAGTIYGSAYERTSLASLYTLSPTTGAATLVGSIGFSNVGAMAFGPGGVLYGIGLNGGGAGALITINTATGAGTQVALITGLVGTCCGLISDMDFRPSDGVLFAREGGDQGGRVYTINTTTGVATLIGTDTLTNADGNAMAFSAGNGLYWAGDANLHTINQSTAAGTLVVAVNWLGVGNHSGPRANGMNLDAAGAVWASVRDGHPLPSLSTINISTGVVTLIGATTSGMDGLAVTGTPVGGGPPPPPPPGTPAPSTLLLIGTGILALWGWSHWRREPR